MARSGVEWIKHFDKHTAAKAIGGKYRPLLMDGHNSHYTHGFLEYAHTHQILVLCYPAHTTHVLQGLDMVVFSVLKHFWTIERDRHERETGGKVDKTNFLGIYGRAHLRTMNPDTIHAAFRKTGIWPLDPDVVTEAMMAPSKETSCEGYLPIKPASPVKAIAKLLRELSVSNLDNKNNGTDSPDGPSNDPKNVPLPAETALSMRSAVSTTLQQLTTTRLAYLISASPPLSTSHLQHNTANPVPKLPKPFPTLVAQTANENSLLDALRTKEQLAEALQRRVLELQAANVLNEMYCSMLRGQLAHYEKRKNSPKGMGKLVGDGLPRLLSGDEFYERVVEFTDNQKRTEREKAERNDAREGRAEAMKEWHKADEERKSQNAVRQLRYKEEKTTWEAAKKVAIAQKKRFGVPAPKLGKCPGPYPKPAQVVPLGESENKGDEDAEDEDRSDNDE